MTRIYWLLLTFGCVLMISTGQILFRMAALRGEQLSDAPIAERWISVPMVSALIVYAVATVLWVWILRHVELAMAYPVFAAAFIIVPVAAHFALGEPLLAKHWIGGLIIIAGILVVANG